MGRIEPEAWVTSGPLFPASQEQTTAGTSLAVTGGTVKYASWSRDIVHSQSGSDIDKHTMGVMGISRILPARNNLFEDIYVESHYLSSLPSNAGAAIKLFDIRHNQYDCTCIYVTRNQIDN